MHIFELAILRILVKRQNAIRISLLIDGFPDNSRADVLLAISRLNNLGFIILSNHYPDEDICLRKDKKKDVLAMMDPLTYLPDRPDEDQKSHHPGKKSERILNPLSVALSILLVSIIGITGVLNNAIPIGNVGGNYVGLVDNQHFGSYFHANLDELPNNHMIRSNSNDSAGNQYYLITDVPHEMFNPLKHASYACHQHHDNLGNIKA